VPLAVLGQQTKDMQEVKAMAFLVVLMQLVAVEALEQ
jgi:hypothetical protein